MENKPNFRIENIAAELGKEEIFRELSMGKDRKYENDRTFGACNCDEEDKSSCSCDSICRCNSQCKHCYCVGDCRCDDHCSCEDYCKVDCSCGCDPYSSCICDSNLGSCRQD